MNRFHHILSATDADAVLILTEVACNYLSRFYTTDGFIAVSREKSVLYTDGRYFEAAEKAVKDCLVACREDTKTDLIAFLGSVGAKKVALETKISYRQAESLKQMLDGFEVVPDKRIDECIEKMREIKSEEEIESLKTAQAITEKAFDHILGFINPGVTDLEIAAELEYVMRKNGAQGLSFETISITGSDTSVPHGTPHGRIVQRGDFVTMDYGAVYQAMHADMTRTVAVGSISKKQREVYETVLAAQLNCIEHLCAGITGQQGDAFARDVIEKAGYGRYFTHATGHGVGYEIHEGPSQSPKSTAVLEAGNCVSVEPGIYLPGRFGVRIEDVVLITKNGCEDLTKADKRLLIL